MNWWWMWNIMTNWLISFCEISPKQQEQESIERCSRSSIRDKYWIPLRMAIIISLHWGYFLGQCLNAQGKNTFSTLFTFIAAIWKSTAIPEIATPGLHLDIKDSSALLIKIFLEQSPHDSNFTFTKNKEKSDIMPTYLNWMYDYKHVCEVACSKNWTCLAALDSAVLHQLTPSAVDLQSRSRSELCLWAVAGLRSLERFFWG